MNRVAPQNRHVSSVAQAFLHVHWDQKKPLLLGYSGGPDSKALLYALLDLGVRPHLAHVDHGWREESAQEALLLKQEAVSLGLPFYTTRLQGALTEDAARKGRLAFFCTLAPGFSAVLLAHQAEDWGETALKRVLEGAHLAFLSGMQPVSSQNGLTIWRPLLSVRKAELLAFLQEKGLSFFDDRTNHDPKYLRVRMRQMLGKELGENLELLAERSMELLSYLDAKIASIPLEPGANLTALCRLERRHYLQRLARKQEFTWPRVVLERLLDGLESGARVSPQELFGHLIWVDQGCIYLNQNLSVSST